MQEQKMRVAYKNMATTFGIFTLFFTGAIIPNSWIFGWQHQSNVALATMAIATLLGGIAFDKLSLRLTKNRL